MYTTGMIVFIIIAAGTTATSNDDLACILLSLNQKIDHITKEVAGSCQEIKERQPSSPSGVYLLSTPDLGTHYVYCHMGKLCGTEGGWTRLAYLDMSDSTKNCPAGFRNCMNQME